MDGESEPIGGQIVKSNEGVAIEALPKEAGIFLLLIGIGGILLPGPVGTPFIVLSGVVFFPKAFRKLDRAISQRFPKSHRQGMRQLGRFVSDLERRYPSRA